MATRARIAMRRADGKVESIYCHWDGYPEAPGAGATLFEHYKDPEKVQALMDLGDVSSLGREIGEKHRFAAHNVILPGPGYITDPECPLAKGWCCSYGRDRGESDCGKIITDSLTCEDIEDSIEYVYLFSPGNCTWTYYSKYGSLELLPLTAEVVCSNIER